MYWTYQIFTAGKITIIVTNQYLTFSSFSPLPTKSPAPAGLFGFDLRISG
jgi:hypothetical protein